MYVSDIYLRFSIYGQYVHCKNIQPILAAFIFLLHQITKLVNFT